MTIINAGKKYRKLKKSIRMINSRRSSTEKIYLVEEGKKIGIDKVIKHDKIIKTMSSYCLKCRKNTESKSKRFKS